MAVRAWTECGRLGLLMYMWGSRCGWNILSKMVYAFQSDGRKGPEKKRKED